jgi:tetratricopeptide (TPR) repeat protein
VLKEIEAPLTKGDFEAQKAGFARMLDRLKPLRLHSIEELEFDARTRLFTALLRAGRQGKVEDAEKEERRKDLLFTIGEIWRALGDERRAALVFAESGRTGSAMQMLEKAGDWSDAAQLSRREGRAADAARLYEQHKDWPHAFEAFREAGDWRGALRSAIQENVLEHIQEATRQLGPKGSRDLLLRHGKGDLLLDMLAGLGEWAEIGMLYERAEQWADAAQAFERAGRLMRAAECCRKAGDAAGVERLGGLEAESRLARGDLQGAGEALRKLGLHEKAVALVREKKPDLAWRWLQQAGLDSRALELAQAEARRHRQGGDLAQAATWLERSGDVAEAALTWMQAAKPEEALRLYEQLGEWEHAGEAALKAGQQERALELFRRAGVPEPEARVRPQA